MIQLSLSGWLSEEVWRVMLVFARVATAFMLLPGYGEPGIPSRVRILTALGFAVAVAAAIGHIPPAPMHIWGLVFGLLAEVTTGAVLGILSRIMVDSVNIAGTVIGQNIGLANIFVQGLGLDQAAAVGGMLYAGMLAILFASGGDHMILRSLVESYHVVPPASWPDVGMSTQAVVQAASKSFMLAGEMAAPFLLIALLFNAALALINRSMPALPVFMLGAPATVLVGMYVMASATPALIDFSLRAYADLLAKIG